jgi:hypothetical protein
MIILKQIYGTQTYVQQSTVRCLSEVPLGEDLIFIPNRGE